jgi:hypothetical protein
MQLCFRQAFAILAATLGFLGSASAADLANGRRIFESTCIAAGSPSRRPETVRATSGDQNAINSRDGPHARRILAGPADPRRTCCSRPAAAARATRDCGSGDEAGWG